MPDLYVPQSTILQTANGVQTHAYLWCYLEREVYGKRYRFNPASLSTQRVKDMPKAIERLSKRFCFDNARPRSVSDELANGMSRFLNWTDRPIHHRRFESILSDPDLALEALKKHHSYLRQRMQANQTENRISVSAASMMDVDAIKMMAVIHDREYGNEIEAIKYIHGDGVRTPKTEDVAAFMACVQGVFDSVARIVLDTQDYNGNSSLGDLRWQSEGRELAVPIAEGIHIERAMELGCMAYAALCVGDSGANLAPIQSYEEPEDLREQLDNPEKLNLRHKVIKFRAGGKEAPVHLTSTTVTRMRSYLRLREALRLRLGSPEIGPMFIQCIYPSSPQARPLGIISLPPNFTSALRSRFSAVGIKLPQVTMQQLRAHKAGKVAKEHNPKVAADMMGHSVSTAIRRYSKITDVEARSEMAPFLASLTSVVLTRSEADATSSKPVTPFTAIPAGGCEDHGHPEALGENPLVEPDCKKTEGCFFCNKFHVHADEEDCLKLMSCRSVLERLAPRLGDSGVAELVYTVVSERIGALLDEIRRINPEAHERARAAVLKEGKLSRYWASKLQQLHLLGLLAQSSALA
ncbi:MULTISPECIES: hypothetical protein [Ralstonia]|jgi:hypothetical protein|nr:MULTISPECIES: hypothetical protein [Ralstonia]EFP64071.1 hypothetical protein HMPREF1004_04325 [Ralstonia pickettii]MCM3584081.1 hypothetical protein [Ralstonia pickettii]MDR9386665.1 hypothetical protein [Ralstonia sp. 11b]